MSYGPVGNYPYTSSYATGTSNNGATSPFSAPFANPDSTDTLSLSGQGEEKKSKGILGAITDFGKGIFKGAINTIGSLFTLKGLALTLGAAAMVAVAAPVAIPLLIAGGLTVGGTQILKGVITGDWEKAGEGTFTIGATMLGAKVGPKTIKGTDGVEYTLNSIDGPMGRPLSYLKSLIPGKTGKVYEGTLPDGTIVSKSGLELGRDHMSQALSGLGSKTQNFFKSAKDKADNPTPLTREDAAAAEAEPTATTTTDSAPEATESEGVTTTAKNRVKQSSPQTSGMIISTSMASGGSKDSHSSNLQET